MPTSMQWDLVGSRAERSHSYGFQDGVDNVRFYITVQRIPLPFLRSITCAPVLLLLLSVGVLLIDDPSFRLIFASLNLASCLAFAGILWQIVPYADGNVKIGKKNRFFPVPRLLRSMCRLLTDNL